MGVFYFPKRDLDPILRQQNLSDPARAPTKPVLWEMESLFLRQEAADFRVCCFVYPIKGFEPDFALLSGFPVQGKLAAKQTDELSIQ